MPATKLKKRNRPEVVESYDVAADAKKRINLRNARTKYFHEGILEWRVSAGTTRFGAAANDFRADHEDD